MSSLTGNMGPVSGRMREKVPSGYRKGAINQYTPEQTRLFRQSFSNLGPESYLSKLAGGDQSQYGEMEAPALRQFNELQGGIASRFSGMGTGGRRSSGFQNTMNQASSNFAQDLQSKRMGLRNQAIQDLMGMSNQLLNQRPQQTTLNPKQSSQSNGSSGWGGLIGAGLGAGAGFFVGGPAGAMGGAQLGYGIGNQF